MSILEANNLIKVYGEGDLKVHALNNVSLKIEQGEFVAIVGPSGSGKSTLLHALGGLDNTDSGSIMIDGVNISDMNDQAISSYRRRKIGFIFQAFNLIPVLTVEENITLPTRLDSRKIDTDYITGVMELLGLQNKRKSYPNELSGGQQQRVAIARALANRPAIIFADEPTGNLDRKTGESVLNILRDSIKKYNQTLVMITHDSEISKIADRVITIEDGRIV
jgi:putative ABC transport system ATP-binding protein